MKINPKVLAINTKIAELSSELKRLDYHRNRCLIEAEYYTKKMQVAEIKLAEAMAEKTNILETSLNDSLLGVRHAINKYFAHLR